LNSLVERYDVATKRRAAFTPGQIGLRDRGYWSGLRLELWDGAASDVPETVLFQHALALNVGDPVASDIRWVGHRAAAGSFEHGKTTLLPAGVPYRTHNRGHWRGLMLAVEPQLLCSVAPSNVAGGIELAPAFAVSDPYLWYAAQSLASDAREGSPTGALYGETVSAALAAHLLRHYSSRPPKPAATPGTADPRVQRIRQFILDQLDRPLALAELAAVAGMDLYTFAKWFKRALGESPHRFVVRARIRRAKERLATSSDGLVEIALDCGFGSHSHFTTTFRRCVGMTPKDYRASASGVRRSDA